MATRPETHTIQGIGVEVSLEAMSEARSNFDVFARPDLDDRVIIDTMFMERGSLETIARLTGLPVDEIEETYLELYLG